MCGGTKWIIRSSRSGNSRSGVGAPNASGLKKLRGSFIGKSGSGYSVTEQTLYHFAAHQFWDCRSFSVRYAPSTPQLRRQNRKQRGK
jgi:hypothetical protein